MSTEITHRFGITPEYVAMQCLSLLFFVLLLMLNIRTTRKVLKQQKGASAPLWILAIWILPFIGALCASSAMRNNQSADPTQSYSK
jgi:hypothetical protein